MVVIAGAADTAKLIAELSLKDKFSGAVKGPLGALGKLEGGFSNLGNVASKGLQTAANNIARFSVIGVAALAGFAVGGIRSLAELETATTSVDGAIAQVGLTGQITSKQVADWANEIEANVGAAFDDKEITASAATLLRYGKVTADNLRPALEVMTDLAAKTGSVESAGELLSKALADPTKAAGKLARQGVILTKVEQDQIKALVAAGKAGEAQKVILDSLAKSTKGAAAASQGPYARSLAVLKDVIEDTQRALGIGFLPLIERVASTLSKKLADPRSITAIQGFGQKLADGFSSALDFAQKIPWGAIGEGLKAGADWAGRLFDLFKGLPPEVQGTIVALAGLDKLSGGAVSGIVGELGKGLIKGVLGMTAGIVNINAGVVNGGGAAPTQTAGGGGGLLGGAAAGLLGGAFFGSLVNQWKNTFPEAGGKLDELIAEVQLNGGDLLAAFKTVADRLKTTDSTTVELLRQGDSRAALLRENGDSADATARAIADAKTAAAIAASRTEGLLRANLSRPIPAPTVNVNVGVNVTAKTVSDAMWESDRYFSTTIAGGSQIRAI